MHGERPGDRLLRKVAGRAAGDRMDVGDACRELGTAWALGGETPALPRGSSQLSASAFRNVFPGPP